MQTIKIKIHSNGNCSFCKFLLICDSIGKLEHECHCLRFNKKLKFSYEDNIIKNLDVIPYTKCENKRD